jgi:hypothetical protein
MGQTVASSILEARGPSTSALNILGSGNQYRYNSRNRGVDSIRLCGGLPLWTSRDTVASGGTSTFSQLLQPRPSPMPESRRPRNPAKRRSSAAASRAVPGILQGIHGAPRPKDFIDWDEAKRPFTREGCACNPIAAQLGCHEQTIARGLESRGVDTTLCTRGLSIEFPPRLQQANNQGTARCPRGRARARVAPATMFLGRIDHDRGYDPTNCRWMERTQASDDVPRSGRTEPE